MARKRVASEPVLRDWAAVDTALRDIRECRHALVELGVEKDRRIDGIKDEYTRNAVPLAIAALKAMGKGELVRTSETLDRQALAKQPAELLESIGAYVKQSDEFYYDVEDEPVTE